uniref:TNFR-Cys domain-containing protein n=1 Tax=Biomphalaria glabrata TaxID=6526 RepID=A0A2C9LCD1_BIOGL
MNKEEKVPDNCPPRFQTIVHSGSRQLFTQVPDNCSPRFQTIVHPGSRPLSTQVPDNCPLRFQDLYYQQQVTMLKALFKVLVLVYLMSTTKTKACDCDPDISFNAVSHVQFKDSSRAGRCEAGQRLDESGRCILCPNGTFLTTSMAKIGRNQECLICHEPNITREEVIQACTPTEDTKVKCSAGHYKPNWSSSCPCSGSQCTVCDRCGLGINLYRDYEVVQCSQFHNAKCCEEEDRDVNCEPRTTPSAAASTALNTISC